jgi:hypothetical protein
MRSPVTAPTGLIGVSEIDLEAEPEGIPKMNSMSTAYR